MEKTSKKLTNTDEKVSVSDVNGYHETHVQNKSEPNSTNDLKEAYNLSTQVSFF